MADASRLLPCLRRLSETHGLVSVTPDVLTNVASLVKDRKWDALHSVIGRITFAAPSHLQEIVLEETSSAMAEEEVYANRLESMSTKRAQLKRDIKSQDADDMAHIPLNLSDDESHWFNLEDNTLPELPALNMPLSPFTPENFPTPPPSPPRAPLLTNEKELSIALECVRGIEDANRADMESIRRKMLATKAAQYSLPAVDDPALLSSVGGQVPPNSVKEDQAGVNRDAQDAFLSTDMGQVALCSSDSDLRLEITPADECGISAAQERVSAAEKAHRIAENAFLQEMKVARSAVDAARAALAAHKVHVPSAPGPVSPGLLPGFQPCSATQQQSELQAGFFEGNTWAPGWTYFGLRGGKCLPGMRPEPNAATVARSKAGRIPRSELARAATPAQKWTTRDIRLLHSGVSRLALRPGFGSPAQWDQSKWDTLRVQCRLNRSAADLMCRYLNADAPSVARSLQKWSAMEDTRLCAAAASMDSATGWLGVAAKVGGKRSALSCLRRVVNMQRAAAARARGSKWSEWESKAVIAAVKVHGSHWCDIALIVGTRTNQSCMNHYRKRQTPGRVVGKWSEREAQVLREAVAKEGESWVRVAKLVPGRNDVQCREKWMNALSPRIRHGMFSMQEKALVLALAHVHNNRWADVSRVMAWRTPKQCLRKCKDLRKVDGRGVIAGKKRRALFHKLDERELKRVACENNRGLPASSVT